MAYRGLEEIAVSQSILPHTASVKQVEEQGNNRAVTKTLRHEQTLEEDPLRIGRLVANANLLVKRTETGFDQIQGAHAIGGEADASTVQCQFQVLSGIER